MASSNTTTTSNGGYGSGGWSSAIKSSSSSSSGKSGGTVTSTKTQTKSSSSGSSNGGYGSSGWSSAIKTSPKLTSSKSSTSKTSSTKSSVGVSGTFKKSTTGSSSSLSNITKSNTKKTNSLTASRLNTKAKASTDTSKTGTTVSSSKKVTTSPFKAKTTTGSTTKVNSGVGVTGSITGKTNTTGGANKSITTLRGNATSGNKVKSAVESSLEAAGVDLSRNTTTTTNKNNSWTDAIKSKEYIDAQKEEIVAENQAKLDADPNYTYGMSWRDTRVSDWDFADFDEYWQYVLDIGNSNLDWAIKASTELEENGFSSALEYEAPEERKTDIAEMNMVIFQITNVAATLSDSDKEELLTYVNDSLIPARDFMVSVDQYLQGYDYTPEYKVSYTDDGEKTVLLTTDQYKEYSESNGGANPEGKTSAQLQTELNEFDANHKFDVSTTLLVQQIGNQKDRDKIVAALDNAKKAETQAAVDSAVSAYINDLQTRYLFNPNGVWWENEEKALESGVPDILKDYSPEVQEAAMETLKIYVGQNTGKYTTVKKEMQRLNMAGTTDEEVTAMLQDLNLKGSFASNEKHENGMTDAEMYASLESEKAEFSKLTDKLNEMLDSGMEGTEEFRKFSDEYSAASNEIVELEKEYKSYGYEEPGEFDINRLDYNEQMTFYALQSIGETREYHQELAEFKEAVKAIDPETPTGQYGATFVTDAEQKVEEAEQAAAEAKKKLDAASGVKDYKAAKAVYDDAVKNLEKAKSNLESAQKWRTYDIDKDPDFSAKAREGKEILDSSGIIGNEETQNKLLAMCDRVDALGEHTQFAEYAVKNGWTDSLEEGDILAAYIRTEGWTAVLPNTSMQKADTRMNNFYYLVAEDGLAEAMRYAARINSSLNIAEKQEEAANRVNAYNLREEYGGTYAAESLANVVIQTVNMFGAWAPDTIHGLDQLVNGVTFYAGSDDLEGMRKYHRDCAIEHEAITSSLQNNWSIPESIPVVGGKDAAWVYQVALSGVQSLTQMLVAGAVVGKLASIVPSLGTTTVLAGPFKQSAKNLITKALVDVAFMGSSTAQVLQQLLEAGVPIERAMPYATANGINEALFETISLDLLLNPAKLASSNFVGMCVSIAMGTGVEGSEEFWTNIFNRMADNVINKDESQFNQSVLNYVNMGYTEERAIRQAYKDIAMEDLDAAIAGAVSSFGSQAPRTIVNYFTAKPVGKYLNQVEGFASALAEKAKNTYWDATQADYETKQAIQKAADIIIEKNGNATDNEVYNLFSTMSAASTEVVDDFFYTNPSLGYATYPARTATVAYDRIAQLVGAEQMKAITDIMGDESIVLTDFGEAVVSALASEGGVGNATDAAVGLQNFIAEIIDGSTNIAEASDIDSILSDPLSADYRAEALSSPAVQQVVLDYIMKQANTEGSYLNTILADVSVEGTTQEQLAYVLKTAWKVAHDVRTSEEFLYAQSVVKGEYKPAERKTPKQHPIFKGKTGKVNNKETPHKATFENGGRLESDDDKIFIKEGGLFGKERWVTRTEYIAQGHTNEEFNKVADSLPSNKVSVKGINPEFRDNIANDKATTEETGEQKPRRDEATEKEIAKLQHRLEATKIARLSLETKLNERKKSGAAVSSMQEIILALRELKAYEEQLTDDLNKLKSGEDYTNGEQGAEESSTVSGDTDNGTESVGDAKRGRRAHRGGSTEDSGRTKELKSKSSKDCTFSDGAFVLSKEAVSENRVLTALENDLKNLGAKNVYFVKDESGKPAMYGKTKKGAGIIAEGATFVDEEDGFSVALDVGSDSNTLASTGGHEGMHVLLDLVYGIGDVSVLTDNKGKAVLDDNGRPIFIDHVEARSVIIEDLLRSVLYQVMPNSMTLDEKEQLFKQLEQKIVETYESIGYIKEGAQAYEEFLCDVRGRMVEGKFFGLKNNNDAKGASLELTTEDGTTFTITQNKLHDALVNGREYKRLLRMSQDIRGVEASSSENDSDGFAPFDQESAAQKEKILEEVSNDFGQEIKLAPDATALGNRDIQENETLRGIREYFKSLGIDDVVFAYKKSRGPQDGAVIVTTPTGKSVLVSDAYWTDEQGDIKGVVYGVDSKDFSQDVPDIKHETLRNTISLKVDNEEDRRVTIESLLKAALGDDSDSTIYKERLFRIVKAMNDKIGGVYNGLGEDVFVDNKLTAKARRLLEEFLYDAYAEDERAKQILGSATLDVVRDNQLISLSADDVQGRIESAVIAKDLYTTSDEATKAPQQALVVSQSTLPQVNNLLGTNYSVIDSSNVIDVLENQVAEFSALYEEMLKIAKRSSGADYNTQKQARYIVSQLADFAQNAENYNAGSIRALSDKVQPMLNQMGGSVFNEQVDRAVSEQLDNIADVLSTKGEGLALNATTGDIVKMDDIQADVDMKQNGRNAEAQQKEFDKTHATQYAISRTAMEEERAVNEQAIEWGAIHDDDGNATKLYVKGTSGNGSIVLTPYASEAITNKPYYVKNGFKNRIINEVELPTGRMLNTYVKDMALDGYDLAIVKGRGGEIIGYISTNPTTQLVEATTYVYDAYGRPIANRFADDGMSVSDTISDLTEQQADSAYWRLLADKFSGKDTDGSKVTALILNYAAMHGFTVYGYASDTTGICNQKDATAELVPTEKQAKTLNELLHPTAQLTNYVLNPGNCLILQDNITDVTALYNIVENADTKTYPRTTAWMDYAEAVHMYEQAVAANQDTKTAEMYAREMEKTYLRSIGYDSVAYPDGKGGTNYLVINTANMRQIDDVRYTQDGKVASLYERFGDTENAPKLLEESDFPDIETHQRETLDYLLTKKAIEAEMAHGDLATGIEAYEDFRRSRMTLAEYIESYDNGNNEMAMSNIFYMIRYASANYLRQLATAYYRKALALDDMGAAGTADRMRDNADFLNRVADIKDTKMPSNCAFRISTNQTEYMAPVNDDFIRRIQNSKAFKVESIKTESMMNEIKKLGLPKNVIAYSNVESFVDAYKKAGEKRIPVQALLDFLDEGNLVLDTITLDWAPTTEADIAETNARSEAYNAAIDKQVGIVIELAKELGNANDSWWAHLGYGVGRQSVRSFRRYSLESVVFDVMYAHELYKRGFIKEDNVADANSFVPIRSLPTFNGYNDLSEEQKAGAEEVMRSLLGAVKLNPISEEELQNNGEGYLDRLISIISEDKAYDKVLRLLNEYPSELADSIKTNATRFAINTILNNQSLITSDGAYAVWGEEYFGILDALNKWKSLCKEAAQLENSSVRPDNEPPRPRFEGYASSAIDDGTYTEVVIADPGLSGFSNENMFSHFSGYLGRDGLISYSRFGESSDATTGEKVLFIDEMQSDIDNKARYGMLAKLAENKEYRETLSSSQFLYSPKSIPAAIRTNGAMIAFSEKLKAGVSKQYANEPNVVDNFLNNDWEEVSATWEMGGYYGAGGDVRLLPSDFIQKVYDSLTEKDKEVLSLISPFTVVEAEYDNYGNGIKKILVGIFAGGKSLLSFVGTEEISDNNRLALTALCVIDSAQTIYKDIVDDGLLYKMTPDSPIVDRYLELGAKSMINAAVSRGINRITWSSPEHLFNRYYGSHVNSEESRAKHIAFYTKIYNQQLKKVFDGYVKEFGGATGVGENGTSIVTTNAGSKQGQRTEEDKKTQLDNVGYFDISPKLAEYIKAAQDKVNEEKERDPRETPSDDGTRFSLRRERTDKPPMRTQWGFKLPEVDKKGVPHALFIDPTKPLEIGEWYDADAPSMEELLEQEPGYAYYVDKDGNIDVENRRKLDITRKNGDTGDKVVKGLPSVSDVLKASDDGGRWMVVDNYADGSKSLYNLGLTGCKEPTVGMFAFRPGFHITDMPSLTHIGPVYDGKKTRKPNQRWFLVEYPIDVDYNQEAYRNPTKDIPDHIPIDGWYSFQTNSGAEKDQHWLISGGMRIVGAVTEKDAAAYVAMYGNIPGEIQISKDNEWVNGKDYDDEEGAINLFEWLEQIDPVTGLKNIDRKTPGRNEMRRRIEEARISDAFFTTETLNNLVLKYSAMGMPDAYIAQMKIKDFLKLVTADDDEVKRIQAEARAQYYKLDDQKMTDAMQDSQMFLRYDEDGRVIASDGAHRAVLLQDAGIETMPVVLESTVITEGERAPQESVALRSESRSARSKAVVVDKMYPITAENRDELKDTFTAPNTEGTNLYTTQFSHRRSDGSIEMSEPAKAAVNAVLENKLTVDITNPEVKFILSDGVPIKTLLGAHQTIYYSLDFDKEVMKAIKEEYKGPMQGNTDYDPDYTAFMNLFGAIRIRYSDESEPFVMQFGYEGYNRSQIENVKNFVQEFLNSGKDTLEVTYPDVENLHKPSERVKKFTIEQYSDADAMSSAILNELETIIHANRLSKLFPTYIKELENTIGWTRGTEEDSNYYAYSISRTPTEIQEMNDKAIAEFGETKNFHDAGFILTDGRMLNFFEGDQPGERHLFHADIARIMDGVEDGYEAIDAFMREYGAVRLLPEAMSMQLGAKPTQEQYEQIRNYVNSIGGRMYMSDMQGMFDGLYRSATYEYDGSVSAEKVAKDIEYFYINGEQRHDISGRYPYNAQFSHSRKTIPIAVRDYDPRIVLDGKDHTAKEIYEIYKDLSLGDELTNTVAEKVFAVADRFGIRYEFVDEKDPDLQPKKGETGETLGIYMSGDPMNRDLIKLNYNWLKVLSGLNSNEAAKLLLHESIHAVTCYAIKTYLSKYGQNQAIVRETRTNEISEGALTPEMWAAAEELVQVYIELSEKDWFNPSSLYAATNPSELIAELYNPLFREQMQKEGFFTRILNAIKKLLGLDTHTSTREQLKRLDRILDDLLSGADINAFKIYANKEARAITDQNVMSAFGGIASEEELRKFNDSVVRQYGETNDISQASEILTDGRMIPRLREKWGNVVISEKASEYVEEKNEYDRQENLSSLYENELPIKYGVISVDPIRLGKPTSTVALGIANPSTAQYGRLEEYFEAANQRGIEAVKVTTRRYDQDGNAIEAKAPINAIDSSVFVDGIQALYNSRAQETGVYAQFSHRRVADVTMSEVDQYMANGPHTDNEIREVFDMCVTDDVLEKLGGKVLDTTRKLYLSHLVYEKVYLNGKEVAGAYDWGTKNLKYSHDKISTAINRGYQNVVSALITHENVHAATCYTLQAYATIYNSNNTPEVQEAYKQFFLDEGIVTEESLAAAKDLYEIFAGLKSMTFEDGSPVFAYRDSDDRMAYATYGTQNVEEALAELTNADFRAVLKQSGVYARALEDEARIILGSELRDKMGDTVKVYANALNTILETVDDEAFDKYEDGLFNSIQTRTDAEVEEMGNNIASVCKETSKAGEANIILADGRMFSAEDAEAKLDSAIPKHRYTTGFADVDTYKARAEICNDYRVVLSGEEDGTPTMYMGKNALTENQMRNVVAAIKSASKDTHVNRYDAFNISHEFYANHTATEQEIENQINGATAWFSVSRREIYSDKDGNSATFNGKPLTTGLFNPKTGEIVETATYNASGVYSSMYSADAQKKLILGKLVDFYVQDGILYIGQQAGLTKEQVRGMTDVANKVAAQLRATNGVTVEYYDNNYCQFRVSNGESRNNVGDDSIAARILEEVNKGNLDGFGDWLTELVDDYGKTQAEKEEAKRRFEHMSDEEKENLTKENKKQQKKYGAKPTGEKQAQGEARQDIPEKRNPYETYSRFWRTIIGADEIPEDVAWHFLKETINGTSSTYSVSTDADAIAYAEATYNEYIDKYGEDGLEKLYEYEWKPIMDKNKLPDKNTIALGEKLLMEASHNRNADITMKVGTDLCILGTELGKGVQAMSLLKKMTPQGQLVYHVRVVNRLNRKYRKEIAAGDMNKIVIDESLAMNLYFSETQEEVEQAIQELEQDIANQIPVTARDRWNAWRYFAMLFNPKTHSNNTFGNGAFVPQIWLKNLIGAAIERLANPALATKSVFISKEYRDFAKQMAEQEKSTLTGDTKFDSSMQGLMGMRHLWGQSVPGKLLEGLMRFNNKALEEEDWWFLKLHYANALAGYLQAQHVNLDTYMKSKEGLKAMNMARLYAIGEAQKATYRDFSAAAAALNALKRQDNLLGFTVEALDPFVKTPINIAKRSVDYSPIGLALHFKEFFKSLKTIHNNGANLTEQQQLDATQAIDKFCAGLSGTAVAVLGFVLGSLGVIRGGGDDDDNKYYMEKMAGHQDYSIIIGDKSYTINWAATFAVPLFFGAEIAQLMHSGHVRWGWSSVETLFAMLSPFAEMTMLSSINSALDAAGEKKYGSAISSLFAGAVWSYFGQGVPTLLSKVAGVEDPYRRSYYIDYNEGTPEWAQEAIQKYVLMKLPSTREDMTLYIDRWGRVSKKELMLRIIENFLLPGYFSTINNTAADAEVLRLYDLSGDYRVLPDYNFKEIGFGIEEGGTKYLTSEEYEAAALERGGLAFSLVNEMIVTPEYAALSDDDKMKAIIEVYTYAKEDVESKMFGYTDISNDHELAEAFGVVDYILLQSDLETHATNAELFNLVLTKPNLTEEQRGMLIASKYSAPEYVSDANDEYYRYELNTDAVNKIDEIGEALTEEYYAKLSASDYWKNADTDERQEMITELREEAAEDARAAMASELAKDDMGCERTHVKGSSVQSNDKRYESAIKATEWSAAEQANYICDGVSGSTSRNKMTFDSDMKTYQKQLYREEFVPQYEALVQTPAFKSALAEGKKSGDYTKAKNLIATLHKTVLNDTSLKTYNAKKAGTLPKSQGTIVQEIIGS